MWKCTVRTVRSAQAHGHRNSRRHAEGRKLALRTFASKTWYEEKYERGFQKKGRERVYTGRKGDDSLKVQLVQW